MRDVVTIEHLRTYILERILGIIGIIENLLLNQSETLDFA